MGIVKEFKEFAITGNIVDLAVAVVIGTAFSKIVAALTSTLIMPIISLLMGKGGVTDLSVTVGNTVFPVGVLLQSVIDFFLVALVLFFVVKAINSMKKKELVEVASTPEDIALLREIRDALKNKH